MKNNHVYNFPLALVLIVSLIFGFWGCSKTDDPGNKELKTETTEQASDKPVGSEELKQVYRAFIGEFKMKPFGQEDEERYSSNQEVVSKAIGELENISGNIEEPGAKALSNKFLSLLKEYNDAVSILESAIRETSSAKEDLNRREEELKRLEEEEKAKANPDHFKYFKEKTEILEERGKLADYGNIGIKKSKVESLETDLYWLHKDFGVDPPKK